MTSKDAIEPFWIGCTGLTNMYAAVNHSLVCECECECACECECVLLAILALRCGRRLAVRAHLRTPAHCENGLTTNGMPTWWILDNVSNVVTNT